MVSRAERLKWRLGEFIDMLKDWFDDWQDYAGFYIIGLIVLLFGTCGLLVVLIVLYNVHGEIILSLPIGMFFEAIFGIYFIIFTIGILISMYFIRKETWGKIFISLFGIGFFFFLNWVFSLSADIFFNTRFGFFITYVMLPLLIIGIFALITVLSKLSDHLLGKILLFILACIALGANYIILADILFQLAR